MASARYEPAMAEEGPGGGAKRDTPRTWKSSPTLAAFLPWGSSERYHHAGCRRRVYWFAGRGRDSAPGPRRQRFQAEAGARVASSAEDSHSGLVRTLGKRVE